MPAHEKVTLSGGAILNKTSREEYKAERDTGELIFSDSDSGPEHDNAVTTVHTNLRKIARQEKLAQRNDDVKSATKFRREQICGRFVLHQLRMHGRMWDSQPVWGSENGEVLVVDPFCGAGTSLMQAHTLAMDAIGLDIDPMAQTLYHGTSTSKQKKGGTFERLIASPHFEWVTILLILSCHITLSHHSLNISMPHSHRGLH